MYQWIAGCIHAGVREIGEPGSLSGFVFALIITAALDFATGVAKAVCQNRVKSETAKMGLIRKMLLFAVVGACAVVDMVLPVDTGMGICKLCTASFVLSEIISILENAAVCGVPIPQAVTRRLEQLSDSTNKDEEKGENGNGEI
ncbi:MAG: holin family protein [Butyricicoccus sp.]